MPDRMADGASLVEAGARIFSDLADQPADPLLGLIDLYRDDPRPDKIDLGVGVYRDETGRTPVMAAVKDAERRLVATQPSKGYLGPLGNGAFVAALAPMVFVADQHAKAGSPARKNAQHRPSCRWFPQRLFSLRLAPFRVQTSTARKPSVLLAEGGS